MSKRSGLVSGHGGHLEIRSEGEKRTINERINEGVKKKNNNKEQSQARLVKEGHRTSLLSVAVR